MVFYILKKPKSQAATYLRNNNSISTTDIIELISAHIV